MNQETRNKLSASLFRMLMYLKLLQGEFAFFTGHALPSNVTGIIFRGKRNYENLITELTAILQKSGLTIIKEVNASEEKRNAIANIVERLYMLEEKQVLDLEAEFEAMVLINYKAEQ